ncbi:MAG: peptide MFS transporter [Planctomycetota bacterium]
MRAAFAGGKERFGFRLIHYSVLANHLHLIGEAQNRRALSRGMQGLAVRIAKGLNRHWGRRGKVFADRYHDHILRTPREVRSALAYVLRNAARHGVGGAGADPYSSGRWFDGWAGSEGAGGGAGGGRQEGGAGGGGGADVAPAPGVAAAPAGGEGRGAAGGLSGAGGGRRARWRGRRRVGVGGTWRRGESGPVFFSPSRHRSQEEPMTAAPTETPADPAKLPTLFGHPAGLYTLFFAEMWERFSYYGMRAILVFYMIRGFLGYGDSDAYAIYGAYTGLVYMMPFFGGLVADRLLGPRRAVVLGGSLMAAGQLLLTVPNETAFFAALGLLICGNGFFKPNISTIVGSLYPQQSPKRDGGFTIFYMGINLGAAMAPLLCGFIGETYGWRYGFGLATIGMLIGLAVFVTPILVTQILVLGGALGTGVWMFFLSPNPYLRTANAVIGLALIISGGVATLALSRGGLPHWAGQPRDPSRLRHTWKVYVGILVAVPLLALLVRANATERLVSPDFIAGLRESAGRMPHIYATFLAEFSTPAGILLLVTLVGAFAFLFVTALRSTRIERHRMYVVLILMFFSLLFWAFFEQAGSSVNLFTDRNVDRVFEPRVVEAAEVGSTLDLVMTQEQLGFESREAVDKLADLRQGVLEELPAEATAERTEIEAQVTGMRADPVVRLNYLQGAREDLQRLRGSSDALGEDVHVQWPVVAAHVGMGVATANHEIPASTFQSVNPFFILVFGLIFTALWAFLAKRRLEPSTPVKFSLGLMQLGLGFGAFWYGTLHADERGMVFVGWLVLGYLLHTTGELCLSPVGLSMVTKLSPKRLVSTVMGAWFLATAASSFVGAIISQFTSVQAEENGQQIIPVPRETVHLYGDLFQVIAYLGLGAGVFCLLLSPVLTRWMHVGEDAEEVGAA